MKNYNILKISFLIVLLMATSVLTAQVYVAGTFNDWDLDTDNEATLKEGIGGGVNYYGHTIQPAAQDEFKLVYTDWNTTWGSGYWIPGTGSFNQKWEIGAGGDNAVFDGDNIGQMLSYVHFCIKDPENSSGSPIAVGILTLSDEPVQVSTVSQVGTLSGDVYLAPVSAQAVNISLSAEKSAEERIYLAYSTDAWSTKSFVEATGSGTSYTATIPEQTDGTEVSYYVLTTTLEATAGGDLESFTDLMTLNYNNNNGTNYNYAVSASASAGSLASTKPVQVYAYQNNVHVTVNSTSPTIGKIVVYNIIGNALIQKDFWITGSGSRSFDITVNQPAGTYIVKVLVNNTAYAEKVFIR